MLGRGKDGELVIFKSGGNNNKGRSSPSSLPAQVREERLRPLQEAGARALLEGSGRARAQTVTRHSLESGVEFLNYRMDLGRLGGSSCSVTVYR